jgi:F-type H+-transporting ATPase subunit gamma
MANLKDLRNRIGSVKNTRKITSAMSRIATARLKKAQDAVLAAQAYGTRMREVVGHLVASIDPAELPKVHPMLAPREVRRVVVVSMTADRGLAGGFNSNINRATNLFVESQRELGRDVRVISVGKKGRAFLKHRGIPTVHLHDAPSHATLVPLSKTIAAQLSAMFAAGDDPKAADGIDLAVLQYNHFVNVLTQEPRALQLLPFPAADLVSAEHAPLPPVFEPDRVSLLAHLLPVALESTLQQAMFNSMAAEVAARRNAMDSATDNATQLIGELTIEYNRERQAAITKELLEIIGGAEALKG